MKNMDASDLSQYAPDQDYGASESLASTSVVSSLLGTLVIVTSGSNLNSKGKVACVTLEGATVFVHIERTTPNVGTYIKKELLNVRKTA